MNIKSANPLKPIQIIYAGGTFGSHGKPLTYIEANTFIPLLLNEIEKELNLKAPNQITFLANDCVKDSSQLTSHDFVDFYELVLKSYENGHQQFVLITGTDTLSYLGAFLAEAFAGSDICIILTGSMRPLFDPEILHAYVRDTTSDAWNNLRDAIGLASFGESSVRINFSGESWHAQTVQKIHSQDLMAFTGHHRAGYPANSYIKSLVPLRRKHWIEDRTNQLDMLIKRSQNLKIAVLYCVPNPAEYLAEQIAKVLSQPATGIILLGFGMGNMPYSEKLATTLDQAYQKGHMIVCSTQCAFGGVGAAYAAGSWQYEHHVLSGGRLTIAAIYARLVWLHLAYDTASQRRARWTYSMNQTDSVRS